MMTDILGRLGGWREQADRVATGRKLPREVSALDWLGLRDDLDAALAALTPQPDTGLREKVAAYVATQMWALDGTTPAEFWAGLDAESKEGALSFADAILAMLPGGTGCLPDDVVRLVIAARAVAFGDDQAEALRELDQASEAFASRVPWDDEPDDAMLSALPEEQGEGKGSPSRASLPVRPSAEGGLGSPLEGET